MEDFSLKILTLRIYARILTIDLVGEDIQLSYTFYLTFNEDSHDNNDFA
jgi:hypothetical protein